MHHLSVLAAAGLLLAACAQAPQSGDPGSVTLLAFSDTPRIEGVENGSEGGLARLRALRTELEGRDPELLLAGAGDFLYPSLLSRLYDGEQVIDVMNLLDGAPEVFDARLFVTFGNHEFDRQSQRDAALVAARLEQSQFHWLGSNIVFAADAAGQPLVAAETLAGHWLVEANGVTVGFLSATTDFTHPDYVAAFEDPVEAARRETAALRAAGADLVVAVTHQSLSADRRILETLGAEGPDLIIGGHEHARNVEDVEGRLIVKADADARSAAVLVVTPRPGQPPLVSVEHRLLTAESPSDPALAARVADWLARHGAAFCETVQKQPPGCLEEVLGHAGARLVAEESEIRRFETNFGSWIADQALAAFRPEADIAFFNAGSFRLNHDLPAGSAITRRHLEELFAYSNELRLIRVSGAMLQQMIQRATEEWEGAGWFLQIAGFAYSFDPETGRVGDLTLLTPQGPRPIRPEEEFLAVTNDFLTEPRFGQDGYTMLTPDRLVPVARKVPNLRDLVILGLAKAEPEGIAPALEGRICNSLRPGPCLAVAQ